MALEDIRNERIKKLNELKSSGGNPYPASVSKTREIICAVLKNFSAREKAKRKVTVVGRLMARRGHGGASFADLKDATGKIQLLFKEDTLGGDQYGLFSSVTDVGDILEVTGVPFTTKRGEKTVEVLKWAMLSKSLRPLPEKWHGLQDVEERFRKRYLDILMNEEVRERFKKRADIVRDMRKFLAGTGFEEAETPMLQSVAGGALAHPFQTHHKALDIGLYLRIAPELYLKRLLVGGFEKVFEIGRDFRNEGIDATHNPEFTMLEAYAAWWDEEAMMKFTESLFANSVKAVFKKGEFEYEGEKIKVKTPFQRIRFSDLLKKYALIPDYESETRESLALRAQRLGLKIGKHEGKGKIADEIYKKICRPRLKEPVFITNHPLDISPLAKKCSADSNFVRRFQLIAGGLEIANGFAELNDPIDQKARFAEQERMRGGGEEEAHRADEDFIESIEYGMPPAAGLGVGIDRLVMLLTNAHNIKEVILFPTMKPK